MLDQLTDTQRAVQGAVANIVMQKRFGHIPGLNQQVQESPEGNKAAVKLNIIRKVGVR